MRQATLCFQPLTNRKWPKGFTYSLDAVKGHLPLTNCLRGTQLFKAILEHPAFERKPAAPPSNNGASLGL